MLFSPTLPAKTYDISNIAMLMQSNANAKKYHNGGKGAIGLRRRRRRKKPVPRAAAGKARQLKIIANTRIQFDKEML